MILSIPSIENLDDLQMRAVEAPIGENLLVTGAPGSGKTLVALYRALFLAQTGESVRVITYNKLLKTYLEVLCKQSGLGENIKIHTAESWLRHLWYCNFGADATSLKFPVTNNFPKLGETDYDRIQSSFSSRRRAGKAINESVHLVVDEGQDLPKGFYALVARTQLSVTVLADENQIITENNSTFGEIRGELVPEELNLVFNRRNTRQIGEFALQFYGGESTGMYSLEKCPEGTLPEAIPFADREDEIAFILRTERQNPDDFIGVALPTRLAVQEFAERLAPRGKKQVTTNPVQVYLSDQKDGQAISFNRPGLKIFTYQSAKGLELNQLFLSGLDIWKLKEDVSLADRKRLFVLATRAKEKLFLTWSSSFTPDLFNFIDPNLLDPKQRI